MTVGDKVRFKGNDPTLSKGAIGIVTNVDMINDIINIKFDNFSLQCTPTEFKDWMELIIETKSDCPAILKEWYNRTGKYLGESK